MTPKNHYPLEPLLQKREDEVDTCAREMSESAQNARQAEKQHAQAKTATQRHADRVKAQTVEETERFDLGESAALDMMHLHAWRLVQQRKTEQLEEQEKATEDRVIDAQKQVKQAQANLATARAHAKVIEKHKERFAAKKRKAEEQRLEDEIEDGFNSRHRRQD